MTLFGLNRFDNRSPEAFAASVARGEALGFDYAFVPSSPLLIQDPYVMLALAALRTTSIRLGPLLENPVGRHPAVIAGSMATLERLAPGRGFLGLGVGDTAVRTIGRSPAKVSTLEEGTRTIVRLLEGLSIDANDPDGHRLRHHARPEVWICAGGPRTFRMAGRVADGVFVRCGTHVANLRAAINEIHAGAREVGRDPSAIKIGAIFHTVLNDDPEVAGHIGRAAAAGYYEYTPVLLERTGQTWDGPDVEELKKHIWQDFHHTPDLVAAGKLLDFLPDQCVDDFCLHGSSADIVAQLKQILALGIRLDIVVTHPMTASAKGVHDANEAFAHTIATEVLPLLR
jgi:alkanesulfonate monooxygenase SsuD/methylene tetrahydromethanopterin reductase-like flavin-dependent oxidoreductase (luciferase family)